VEAKVLEQEDLAVLASLDGLLDLVTDAVVEEGDGLAEELLELLGLSLANAEMGQPRELRQTSSAADGTYDRGKRVLLDLVAVGAAEVRHQDDRGGACRQWMSPVSGSFTWPSIDASARESHAPCSMACLMVGRAATIRCAEGKEAGRGQPEPRLVSGLSQSSLGRRPLTAGLVISPVDLSWGTLKSERAR
jgi:hypothetical protein